MATKPSTSASKKTKRSTTRAASTTPKAAAKTVAKAPKATVVSTKAKAASAQADVAARPEMTKKDLVESMMSATGMKKGEARRALEATMSAVADALKEGKDLAVPPLGKIKIARTKETPNGKLVVLRAKLKEPKPPVSKDPLAEAAE